MLLALSFRMTPRHPMRFLRDDTRGFSGAEKALLACFALAIILLIAKLIGGGNEQAAGDARRTLASGMSSVGGTGSLGNVLRPQDLVRADRPVAQLKASGTVQAAQQGGGGGGFLDAVGGFFRSLGSAAVSVLEYASGAAGQFVSNILFGGLDPILDQNGSGAYQEGRRLGDAASVAAGAFEIFEGGGMIGGAIAFTAVVEVGTVGVATPVVVIVDGAALAGGLAMIGHGSWMVGKGIDGLGKDRTPDGPDSPGGGGSKDLVGQDGKFKDAGLEDAYKRYVERKTKAGETPRDRLDWKEARDYWLNDSPTARGNRFNQTAGKKYDYNEVHLENGKRLDSYDPDKGEIISRKATDFDAIEPSTFKSYLKELRDKYPAGTKIRSNKYPDIDGQPLQGRQILEVPESNRNAANRAEFERVAREMGIEIRYTPE